jgi:hypothetical protein
MPPRIEHTFDTCQGRPVRPAGEALLDRRSLALVLAAIAHAGGSHEHSRVIVEDDEDGVPVLKGSERRSSLYSWPEPAAERH